MAGWEGYKKAIKAAGEQYWSEEEAAWKLYQSEMANVFANPKMNAEMGRVTTARAIARFWSRTEKVGMNLAGAEQAAFDANIKPLRPQQPAPKQS